MDYKTKSWWGMGSAAFISALSFGLIIFACDPATSHWLIFGLLFLSLLIALSGITTPLVHLWHNKRPHSEDQNIFILSIRQGLLISLTITAFFVLQTLHVLAWWNGFLVLAIAVILELYFKR